MNAGGRRPSDEKERASLARHWALHIFSRRTRPLLRLMTLCFMLGTFYFRCATLHTACWLHNTHAALSLHIHLLLAQGAVSPHCNDGVSFPPTCTRSEGRRVCIFSAARCFSFRGVEAAARRGIFGFSATSRRLALSSLFLDF